MTPEEKTGRKYSTSARPGSSGRPRTNWKGATGASLCAYGLLTRVFHINKADLPDCEGAELKEIIVQRLAACVMPEKYDTPASPDWRRPEDKATEIAHWNDAPGRTKEEVLKALRTA